MIYKHRIVSVTEFTNDYMGPLLEKLPCEKKIILICDININILNCDSDKDTTDFFDTISASLLYPTINTPTWITATSKTLIDNTFYNDFTNKITAGNIAISISDHLTQFLIIRDQTTNFDNSRKKEVPKIWKFSKEHFLAYLTQIDWNNYLKIYNNNRDLSFDLFLRKINFLYNKHSLVITSKRKNNYDPFKPWLTPGVIKSIRIKNNLYKQFCQATNPTQRVSLHQKFKNYRNEIVTLNCLCKEDYFKAYFETNKKD